jgi:hypothetical protein
MTYSTIRYYPQDPKTTPPMTARVKGSVFGEALSGRRILTTDKNQLADPRETYDPESFQFAQLNSHYLAHKTVDLAEGYLRQPISWSGGNHQLQVRPHAQPGKNAYYQNKPRASVNHMYFRVPEEDKTVRTALSADVISHEVGHSILDGMRPDLVEEPDAETLAFHEAFGDCMSMLLALSQPANRGYLLYQTGGDLRKESLLSKWAEELGSTLNRYEPDGDSFIRSHLHNMRYRSAKELPPPRHGKDKGDLNNGPHSYSQVFSGAFFDILVELYEKGIRQGMPCTEAMDWAQSQAGPLLLKSVSELPHGQASFPQVATGMLSADGGEHGELLREVFARRELVTVDMPDWSAGEFRTFNQAGGLTGKVHRSEVSENEAEEMKLWIESHMDFLIGWDKNDGQIDYQVKNPSFWGCYGGDKESGSTALWDHSDYVERANFSEDEVTLVGFNRDGRGWYFHYDREQPGESFRQFRKER